MLPLLKVDAIYTSPLQRCIALAKDLQNTVKLDSITPLDKLKEINFGDWEEQPWDSIAIDEIERWNANRNTFQFPNGETPGQFHLRVVQVLQNIVSMGKDQCFY